MGSDDAHFGGFCPAFSPASRERCRLSGSTSHSARNLWKLIPGFAISAFFLWRVLRDLKMDRLRSMRLVHPGWIVVLVFFFLADYGLRGYRWWFMLRSVKARFSACLRVLMTSLAANNILPFRIGDFMRIFAYAPDVNAPSSTVLSTVLLERLLDIFMLFAFLVIGLHGADANFPPVAVRGHSYGVLRLAEFILVLAALGLGLLLFGTHLLHRFTQKLVARFGQRPRTQKLGEWSVLLFDAVLHLSFPGRVWLLAVTAMVWTSESMLFVAFAKMIGIVSHPRGPWIAAALSNLSFLLPSAPGGVGPFEASGKVAMQSQGAHPGDAALYALLVHLVTWIAITLIGGIAFLVHRASRKGLIKPLVEDLAALPNGMEVPPEDLPQLEFPNTR